MWICEILSPPKLGYANYKSASRKKTGLQIANLQIATFAEGPSEFFFSPHIFGSGILELICGPLTFCSLINVPLTGTEKHPVEKGL